VQDHPSPAMHNHCQNLSFVFPTGGISLLNRLKKSGGQISFLSMLILLAEAAAQSALANVEYHFVSILHLFVLAQYQQPEEFHILFEA
jgi:hypothetical protein